MLGSSTHAAAAPQAEAALPAVPLGTVAPSIVSAAPLRPAPPAAHKPVTHSSVACNPGPVLAALSQNPSSSLSVPQPAPGGTELQCTPSQAQHAAAAAAASVAGRPVRHSSVACNPAPVLAALSQAAAIPQTVPMNVAQPGARLNQSQQLPAHSLPAASGPSSVVPQLMPADSHNAAKPMLCTTAAQQGQEPQKLAPLAAQPASTLTTSLPNALASSQQSAGAAAKPMPVAHAPQTASLPRHSAALQTRPAASNLHANIPHAKAIADAPLSVKSVVEQPGAQQQSNMATLPSSMAEPTSAAPAAMPSQPKVLPPSSPAVVASAAKAQETQPQIKPVGNGAGDSLQQQHAQRPLVPGQAGLAEEAATSTYGLTSTMTSEAPANSAVPVAPSHGASHGVQLAVHDQRAATAQFGHTMEDHGRAMLHNNIIADGARHDAPAQENALLTEHIDGHSMGSSKDQPKQVLPPVKATEEGSVTVLASTAGLGLDNYVTDSDSDA